MGERLLPFPPVWRKPERPQSPRGRSGGSRAGCRLLPATAGFGPRSRRAPDIGPGPYTGGPAGKTSGGRSFARRRWGTGYPDRPSAPGLPLFPPGRRTLGGSDSRAAPLHENRFHAPAAPRCTPGCHEPGPSGRRSGRCGMRRPGRRGQGDWEKSEKAPWLFSAPSGRWSRRFGR